MRLFKQFIVVCMLCILTACSPEWTDEVLLHDGRIIHVTRTVSMTTSISLSEGRLLDRTATFYGLKASNPNTNEKISWRSNDKFINPVLIDFDGTTTYLVIHLPNYNDIKTQFGCTWPPYVFLRHEQNKEWDIIATSQAPIFLRFANLSFRYDSLYMKQKLQLYLLRGEELKRVSKLSDNERVGFQTIERIRSQNLTEERHQYDFQVEIPRRASEWKFKPRMIPACQ